MKLTDTTTIAEIHNFIAEAMKNGKNAYYAPAGVGEGFRVISARRDWIKSGKGLPPIKGKTIRLCTTSEKTPWIEFTTEGELYIQ